MQTNELTGFILLLVLSFFWDVFMGWEIIQTRAHFLGFKSTEIDIYLEEIPSLHRTFYRRLGMKARPEKDIAFTVLQMAFYMVGGFFFPAILIYRLFQTISESTFILTLAAVLILTSAYVFFLSAGVRVKRISR